MESPTDKASEASSEEVADFERVIRQHGGSMLAVARRLLGNESDAHDCLQEAFLQAFGKLNSFQGRAALRTWLHRIVVNTALMALRRRKRKNGQPIDPRCPNSTPTGAALNPLGDWRRAPTA